MSINNNIFNVAPGETSTVGTCNTSTDYVFVGTTLYGQSCARRITATGNQNMLASDAGNVVLVSTSGVTLKAFDPSSATQGTTYAAIGDGNAFTLTTVTAGSTEIFHGCTGSGSTSMAVPANAEILFGVDNSGANPNYWCILQGASSALATSSTPGIVQPDNTSITINGSGVISATGPSATPSEVFISAVSATLGTSSSIVFSPLPTTYNSLHLICTGLLQDQSGAQPIDVQVGEGSTPTWETAATYSSAGTFQQTGSPTARTTSSATDVMDAIFGYANSTLPTQLDVRISPNPSTSGVYKLIAGTFPGATWGGAWIGDTNPITAIRLLAAAGTMGGRCTLAGQN